VASKNRRITSVEMQLNTRKDGEVIIDVCVRIRNHNFRFKKVMVKIDVIDDAVR
jgi:hypothetical protein